VGKGTGLGLSAVAGIALSHGGGLTIRTGAGRGTTVTLHLAELPAIGARGPARTEAPGAPERPRGAPTANPPLNAAAGNGRGDGGRALVLVVDDERSLADMTADTVGRLGHQVLTTTSARQALELIRLRHGEIAHLVTDLNMPEMTGSELADAAKRIDPAITVTLVSGRSALAGVNGRTAIDNALEKPVARQQLAQVLKPAGTRRAGD
jgi:CheY-like chemotaxis protein